MAGKKPWEKGRDSEAAAEIIAAALNPVDTDEQRIANETLARPGEAAEVLAVGGLVVPPPASIRAHIPEEGKASYDDPADKLFENDTDDPTHYRGDERTVDLSDPGLPPVRHDHGDY